MARYRSSRPPAGSGDPGLLVLGVGQVGRVLGDQVSVNGPSERPDGPAYRARLNVRAMSPR